MRTASKPKYRDVELLNASLLCEALEQRSPLPFLNRFNYCSLDGLACSTRLPSRDESSSSFRYAFAEDRARDTLYLVVCPPTEDDHPGRLCGLAIPKAYNTSIDYGAVHRGCLDYAQTYLPLVELQTEHNLAGRRLVLCGHGWGGTIASIATTILLKNATFWKDRIVCYTFGAPLFASQEFVDTLNTVGDSAALEHWVHPDDIHPRLVSLFIAAVDQGQLKRTFTDFRSLFYDLLPNMKKEGWRDFARSLEEANKMETQYVPLGPVFNIQTGLRGDSLALPLRAKQPLDVVTILRAMVQKDSTNGGQFHEMKSYRELLLNHVTVKPQFKTQSIPEEPYYMDVPYETKNTHELWEPRLSDLCRAGLEDGNKIRFEILGHRLGTILPLSCELGDVSLDLGNGRRVEIREAHLIWSTSTALSYYFPLSNIPPEEPRLSCDCPSDPPCHLPLCERL